MKIKSQNSFAHILLFFLQPTVAAFCAISNWWRPLSGVIIIMFTTLVGFVAEPPRETMDLYYYLSEYQNGYATYGDFSLDFYVNFLRTILIKYTQNPHIFMAVVGLVVGICVAKSIKQFAYTKDTILGAAIIFIFTCSCGLFVIGGVRFITAFYLFFWGVTSFLNNFKTKYLILVLLSPIVHFSFLVAVFIFIISILCYRWDKLLKYVVIFSFIYSLLPSSITYEYIFTYLLDISGIYAQRIASYANVDYAQELIESSQNASFLMRYGASFPIYTIVIISYLLYKKRTKLNIDSSTRRFIVLSACLYIFINIFAYVPDLGSRFESIFKAFSIYTLYSVYRQNLTFPSIKKYMYILCFSFFVDVAYCMLMNLDIFPIGKAIKPLLLHII